MEIAGNRWSKPHVSTPFLKGWLDLRSSLRSGLVLIDLEAKNLNEICDVVVEKLTQEDFVPNEQAANLKELWLKKHRHQFEGPRKVEGNLSRVLKDLLVQKLESKTGAGGTLKVPGEVTTPPTGGVENRRGSITVIDRSRLTHDGKVNVALQKKISNTTEAAIILEGVFEFLEKPISVFIRLGNPVVLKDLPEVDIPTRFLYFYAGPQAKEQEKNHSIYMDLGISLATALTDRGFAAAAYAAQSKSDILDALDVYTNGLRILPSDYNAELHKIEPPANVQELNIKDDLDEIDEDRRMREQMGLVRTGKFAGGLINDIKRKKPHYISDFLQGFHPQCISSFLFLYFACLAPIVAFGGLLGEATENRIATIESLISGLISGVLFGLFSGQPLIILGSTGPVYVFEKILYQICTDQNWDYLSLRLWIGIWVGLILILLVLTDASAYVCYITRFTEELFATLIAFIFITNAVKNVFYINNQYKFRPEGNDLNCACEPFNGSMINTSPNMTGAECAANGGQMIGENCDYEPNVFLMSFILFAGTFTISFSLKNFRNTGYLPGRIRDFLSDFAVITAIILMTLLNYFADVKTPKLIVPASFQPTWEGRDWVVTHALIFPDHLLTNPWWVDVFLAPVLAILATILIFMDQQITAVIVNRKEHKLKKGGGYHLDLLILAFIVIICSVFGLPWFVAATVLSINHIQSLTKETESSAPGEKPQFLGIREQRVTSIMIAICIGLSTFITPILSLIPMPVLFGVFLFMGVSSLRGLQFFDRLLLLFIPRKYQPDYVFLKYVPLHRVHLFTFFQLFSLIGLWIIKSQPTTSIGFPVMLVVICAIRKFMECVFTRRELRVLDDLLPENGSNKMRRGGSFFHKKFGKEDVNDWTDPEAVEAAEADETRKRQETEAILQRQKIRALALEMDDFGKVDVKSKTRNYLYPTNVRSRKSISAVATGNKADERPKCLIFARFKDSDQSYFTPVNLNTRTVGGLLRRLEAKFADDIKPNQVAKVFKKSRAGLMFQMDDDMIDLLQPNTVFDVQLNEIEDGKFDMILTEVDNKID